MYESNANANAYPSRPAESENFSTGGRASAPRVRAAGVAPALRTRPPKVVKVALPPSTTTTTTPAPTPPPTTESPVIEYDYDYVYVDSEDPDLTLAPSVTPPAQAPPQAPPPPPTANIFTPTELVLSIGKEAAGAPANLPKVFPPPPQLIPQPVAARNIPSRPVTRPAPAQPAFRPLPQPARPQSPASARPLPSSPTRPVPSAPARPRPSVQPAPSVPKRQGVSLANVDLDFTLFSTTPAVRIISIDIAKNNTA